MWDRLGVISCPTLVCCGASDGIAPPEWSGALVRRIVGAELRRYQGGHAFVAQDPAALPDIISFLASGWDDVPG